MFKHLTRFIRDKYHPLFALRRNKFFAQHLMPILDVPLACRLTGIKWKVYLRSVRNFSLILDSDSYDPGISSLFIVLSELTRPRIFWDVGANVGFYSWMLMSWDEEIEVVLFEPDPDNASLIAKTIKRASLKNATLVRQAVSNKSGIAEFALDRASGATGTLHIESTFSDRLFGYQSSTIKVDTVSLDQRWRQNLAKPPDLIKIDVEMAEDLVFEGARDLIRNCQPIIIFECGTTTRPPLVAYLKALGYSIVNADEPDTSAETAVNILALPASHQAIFEQLLMAWRKARQNQIGA